MTPSTLLDDFAARSPDSIITITHPGNANMPDGILLAGILSDATVIQELSVQYGDGAKALTANIGSAITGAVGGMGGKMGMMASGAGKLVSGAGSMMTDKRTMIGNMDLFESTGKVSQSFNAQFFYGWHRNPSYKQMDLMFNFLTQPTLESTGFLGSNLYTSADLGDITTLNYDALKGKLPTVSLGNWFRATDVYINSISKQQSAILDENEYPMSLQVSFTITPFRQLTAQELNKWIVK